jgi:hypothetical protein
MGIGISVLVGAIGAILRYAFTGPVNQQGFDVHTGGVILMFVGALGLVLSMLFWSSFAPFGRGRLTTRREEVISKNGEVQGSRVVRETRDVAN